MNNKSATWTAKTNHNTKRLAFWTFIWLLTMALAAFGPKLLWNENQVVSTLAIIVNFGFGMGMILANIRFINGLDEMQKKIQLESLAIALGVGIVSGLSYSLLHIVNVLSGGAEISLVCVVVSITYIVSLLIGQKRYA